MKNIQTYAYINFSEDLMSHINTSISCSLVNFVYWKFSIAEQTENDHYGVNFITIDPTIETE